MGVDARALLVPRYFCATGGPTGWTPHPLACCGAARQVHALFPQVGCAVLLLLLLLLMRLLMLLLRLLLVLLGGRLPHKEFKLFL